MHWHGSRIGKDLPSNFNFCLKRMAKIRSACRYYNGGKVTAITAVDFSRAMLEALPVDWGWFEIGLPPVIHSCLGFSINQAFLDTPIYGNPHIIVKKNGLQTIERLSGVFDVSLESILINSCVGLDYCACKPKGNTTMIIIIISSSSSPPPSSSSSPSPLPPPPPSSSLSSSSSSSSSSRHHHHQQQQHHHYTCMFPSSALLFLHDHLVFLHHSALLHMIAQVADEKRKEIEVRKTTLPARQLIQHTVLQVMDVSFFWG